MGPVTHAVPMQFPTREGPWVRLELMLYIEEVIGFISSISRCWKWYWHIGSSPRPSQIIHGLAIWLVRKPHKTQKAEHPSLLCPLSCAAIVSTVCLIHILLCLFLNMPFTRLLMAHLPLQRLSNLPRLSYSEGCLRTLDF